MFIINLIYVFFSPMCSYWSAQYHKELSKVATVEIFDVIGSRVS